MVLWLGGIASRGFAWPIPEPMPPRDRLPSSGGNNANASQRHRSAHIGLACLEELAAEMIARSYQAELCMPVGGLAYLDLRNPRASVLAERVNAHGGVCWWSWQEKTAGCYDVATPAGILARVLWAVGE